MKLTNRRACLGAAYRCVFPKYLQTTSLLVAGLLVATSAFSVDGPTTDGRNIDRRLDQASRFVTPAPTAAQLQSINALRASVPGLLVTYDRFGATASLSNPTGPLVSGAGFSGQDPETTAQQFLQRNTGLLGLTSADLNDMVLTDRVESISGVTHLYYGQRHNGLDVYNAQLQVHVVDNGAISLVNNSFVPGLASNVSAAQPTITAEQAVQNAAAVLGVQLLSAPRVTQRLATAGQSTQMTQAQLSPEPIVATLILLPVQPGTVVPAWNFQFQLENSWPDITVDATTGELVTSFDWMSNATFRVYEQPVESPNHTSPTPPSDARTLVVNPEDSTASRNGWFDAGTTRMDGNNVHACADRNGNNSCDTPEPTCSGNLTCDFALNLNADPVNSLSAAITNLFYWNNTIHDIQYQYGFNEQGGNFQENNFGLGGAGSDSVNAEAQDNAAGGSDCNANFGTPADGGNPRMQMFLCRDANPARDGDYDNGVIVHEYGHGISTRQVGGPGNSSCLSNTQQAGEGWSDFFALVYTADAGDQGSDARGVGSYLFNLPTTGTIRPQRYSTNPAINNYTYESIQGLAVPHGVGSVWAQAIWEVYWALVDEYGFEGDLLNFNLNDPNEAGNKRALFYVNEGLQNTQCRPTFVANRDGIIAAATNSFGGADVCRLWDVFASYGLGTDAVSGGANSTNPTNGFSVPPECDAPPPPPPPPPDDCLASTTFENGAGGWTQGNNSCTTGAFVVGSPTQTTSGGVITQVAGGAGGSANALFTATNSSAGVNDVDGGTCEAISPTVNASSANAVEVSLDYFHGQRDAGDDANDGFTIEVLNNGAVVNTLVSIGDVTNTADWTAASTTVNNPGNISVRVRASDGAGPGDIVEGGVDNFLVCPTGGPPPGCTVDDDFENGAAGWSNSGAATCTTGAYVLGTPSEQTNGGVITQVGGANSGVNAIFTATNTSAGVNDVDGGVCILTSPNFNVNSSSTLSVSYFHGQRDAGDDGNDFFALEVSTDGGNNFQSIASNGDTTSNAVWTNATASIPAGSNVVLRARCSDGAGPGDLVECGIDDVSICPN